MPTAIYYRAFVNRLAHLADARNPAHICVAAAGIMPRQLSPANQRRLPRPTGPGAAVFDSWEHRDSDARILRYHAPLSTAPIKAIINAPSKPIPHNIILCRSSILPLSCSRRSSIRPLS